MLTRSTRVGVPVVTLKYLSAISILNFAKSFATAIIEELDSRFAYLGILDKFQIIYPQKYLGMDKKNIDEYGKDSFFDILKYFCGAERTYKLFDLYEWLRCF